MSRAACCSSAVGWALLSSHEWEVRQVYPEQDVRQVFFSSPPPLRYVLPDTANYYEGTGFSKMLINKKSSTLFISMSLHSRSENGLIAYLGTKVTLDLSLWISVVNLRALNLCLFFLTQDVYFAVTVEKGVVFLHSNLLERPATNNQKMFPVGVLVSTRSPTPLRFLIAVPFCCFPLRLLSSRMSGSSVPPREK